jgi:sec-independent protein translocase protein TatB
VLGNLNGWELIILGMLGLFLFGPERLPKVISDATRVIRGIRNLARNATQELSRELGTEVTLEDLHPKTFIRKHILSDEEQQALRRPLDDLAREMRGIDSDVRRSASQADEDDNGGRHRADPDAT